MPKVIVNTSPIQYLYQTNLLDLLPQMYGNIILPQGVAIELAEGRSLGVALPNTKDYPWFRPVPSPNLNLTTLSAAIDILGRGELEAIALGLENPDSLVILDDGLARNYAKDLGVKITGTIGVLLKAKQRGYLNLIKPVIEELILLGFRLDGTTREFALRLAEEL
jgi:predicted nucleic acid-binding protein